MSIYRDIDYRLNTKNKDIKLSEDIEAINNAVRNILLTRKYSVPGKPDFGCDLENALFEQIDEITLTFIEGIIRTEIEKWEPRIIIRDVSFRVPQGQQMIMVSIQYIIIRTNEIETADFKIGQYYV